MKKNIRKNLIRVVATLLIILLIPTGFLYADDVSIQEEDIITTESSITSEPGLKTTDEALNTSDESIDENSSEDDNNQIQEEDQSDDEQDDTVSDGSIVPDSNPTEPGITTPNAMEEERPESRITTEGAVYISSFDELKANLEDSTNNNQDFILVDDIQAKVSGIRVSDTKTDVFISGLDPQTGEKHTYVDAGTGGQTQNMVIGNNTTITIEDMVIDGHNYFGVVNAPDGRTNVNIVYERVEYNGPQLAFIPTGTLYIRESSIVIPERPKPNSAASEEIAEAGKVVLEGNTDIQKLGGTTSLFRLYARLGPEIIVAKDANVDITGVTYLILREGATPADFNVQDGGSVRMMINGGMSAAGQNLGNINVENNGEFKYIHDGALGSLRTIILNGNLEVGNNSVFDVRRTQKSFNGTALTRILVSMETRNSHITMNDPKRVILVNSINTTDGLIRFSNGGDLNINAQAMNLWNTLPSIFGSDIDADDPKDQWSNSDLPQNIWNQDSGQEIQMIAGYTAGSPVNTQNVTLGSPYEPASDNNTQSISASNFLSTGTKMFTIGQQNIDFDQIVDGAEQINGSTTSNAYVEAEYGSQNNRLTGNGFSGDDGRFSIGTEEKLVENTTVQGISQNMLLRVYDQQIVEPQSGALRFLNVPEIMEFGVNDVPTEDTIIPRENLSWNIQIEDTRNHDNPWSLYGEVENPLTAEANGENYELPNSLIYRQGDQNESLESGPVLVYSGNSNDQTEDVHTVSWSDEEGPLLRILQGDPVKANVQYKTTIKWTLVDAPQ